MPLPPIDPPLINSAEQDLQALFDCPHTGAVTTRTSVLQGFEHDDAIHQYAFFNPQDYSSSSDSGDKNNKNKNNKNDNNDDDDDDDDDKKQIPSSTSAASLNTLGYSPIPLATYLSIITKITTTIAAAVSSNNTRTKPFIISTTGTPSAITQSHRLISATASQIPPSNPICIELNLSCPNIPNKPPPAYSKTALLEYLNALGTAQRESETAGTPSTPIPIGLKTPPYTHAAQFHILIDALLEAAPHCKIDFLTATNTLGSSLLLQPGPGDSGYSPALSSASGLGIGGLAGAPLHPLALGNVKILRGLLDEREELRHVKVIGVGGVGDCEGFARMRAVGAEVVGVGTALGREGVGVFEKILRGGGGERAVLELE